MTITTLEQATKRIKTLEETIVTQAALIGDLQTRNEIMDKRILEQLKGLSADFDNRVIQAINKAMRENKIALLRA